METSESLVDQMRQQIAGARQQFGAEDTVESTSLVDEMTQQIAGAKQQFGTGSTAESTSLTDQMRQQIDSARQQFGDAAVGESVGGIRHAVGQTAKGIAGTFSNALRALALEIEGPDQDLLEGLKTLQEGKTPVSDRYELNVRETNEPGKYGFFPEKNMLTEPVDWFILSTAHKASPEERQAFINRLEEQQIDATQSKLYETGDRIDQWVSENVWNNPEIEQSGGVKGFFANDLPQGIGSMIGFIIPAIATRGATARSAPAMANTAAFAETAAMGAAVNEGAEFAQALDDGATISEAFELTKGAKLIGTSEAAPIFSWLERADEASGGTLKQALKRVLIQGSEEAVQEFGSEVANALNREAVYNPDKGVWEVLSEAGQQGAVGFTTGALMQAIGSILIPGKQGGRGPQRPSEPTSGGAQDRLAAFDQAVTEDQNNILDPNDESIPLYNEEGDLIREGESVVDIVDQKEAVELGARRQAEAEGGDNLDQAIAAQNAIDEIETEESREVEFAALQVREAARDAEIVEQERQQQAAVQQAEDEYLEAYKETPEGRVLAKEQELLAEQADAEEADLAANKALDRMQRAGVPIQPGTRLDRIVQQRQAQADEALLAQVEAAVPAQPAAQETRPAVSEPDDVIAAAEKAVPQQAGMPLRKSIDNGKSIDFKRSSRTQATAVPRESLQREPVGVEESPVMTSQNAVSTPSNVSTTPSNVTTTPSDVTSATDTVPAIKQRLDAQAHEAATSPRNDLASPTDAQIEVGNYKKGHVTVSGLDISIENPKDSTRSGVDPGGKPWSQTMKHHYGYIRRTEGRDGDQVDVFIGENPSSERVFVVDQIDQKTRRFDEHKVMVGFDNQQQARRAYLSNYDKNWEAGPVTELSMTDFKAWLEKGDQKKALSPSLQTRETIASEVDSVFDVRREVERMNTAVPGVNAAVVDSFDQLPEAIRSQSGIKAQKIRAVYDQTNDRVYVVGNKHATPTDVERSVLHEGVAHKGLRYFMPQKQLDSLLDSVYSSANKVQIARLEKQYGFDSATDTGRRDAAEEYIAKLAETPKQTGVMSRVVSTVRRALRSVGLAKSWTDNDIHDLLRRVRKKLARGGTRQTVDEGAKQSVILDVNPQKPSLGMLAHAGDTVSGLKVRKKIPNSSSIESSLTNYSILTGVRELPLSVFENTKPTDMFYAKDDVERSKLLGKEIVQNKEINPIIAVQDEKGYYILEGAHRVAGLSDQGIENIPALIVIDNDKINKKTSTKRQPDAQVIKSKIDKPQKLSNEEIKARYSLDDESIDQASESPTDPLSQGIKTAQTVEEMTKTSFDRKGIADRIKKSMAAEKTKRGKIVGTLKAVSTRNIADFAHPSMTAVKNYNYLNKRMTGRESELTSQSKTVIDPWIKLHGKNREQSELLTGVMHRSTLMRIDPSRSYQSLVDVDEEQKRIDGMYQSILNGAKNPLKIRQAIEAKRAAISSENSRQAMYNRLRDLYNSLDDEARQIYTDTRDLFKEQYDTLQSSMQRRIDSLSTDDKTKQALRAFIEKTFESGRIEPYFPLSRYGKYWANAKEGNSLIAYSQFDKQWERDEWMREWKKAGATIDGGVDSQAGMRGEGPGIHAMDPGFTLDVVKKLKKSNAFGTDEEVDSLIDDIWQMYLKSLPEMSARKHFIHRKSVMGFTGDGLRSVADATLRNARRIAKVEYQYQVENTLRAIEEQAKKVQLEDEWSVPVYDELRSRHDWHINHTSNPVASALTSMGFHWYLGFIRPSAGIVNLTQTAIVGLPTLASFAEGNSSAFVELSKSARDVASLLRFAKDPFIDPTENKHFSKDDRRALRDIENKFALFDKTRTHDLIGLQEAGGKQITFKWHQLGEISGWVFHNTEVYNRKITALAGYRLGRQKGLSHDEAVYRAVQLTEDSHFDYSSQNRPAFMHKDWARVAFLFRNYSVNMYYYLMRNFHDSIKGASKEKRIAAGKRFYGTMGMTALLAGGGGLPFVWSIAQAFEMLWEALDDDEREDMQEIKDVKTRTREFVSDLIGDEGADILMNGAIDGVPRALNENFDLGIPNPTFSSRLTLANIAFQDAPANAPVMSREWWSHYVGELMGPSVGLIQDFGDAGYRIYDGDHTAWQDFTPSTISDQIKAVRMMMDGIKTRAGAQVIEKQDLEASDYAMQMIGFTPYRVSKQYEKNRAMNFINLRLEWRADYLRASLRNATRFDSDVNDIEREIRDFNSNYPEWAIDVGRTIRDQKRLDNRFMDGLRIRSRKRQRALKEEFE